MDRKEVSKPFLNTFTRLTVYCIVLLPFFSSFAIFLHAATCKEIECLFGFVGLDVSVTIYIIVVVISAFLFRSKKRFLWFSGIALFVGALAWMPELEYLFPPFYTAD